MVHHRACALTGAACTALGLPALAGVQVEVLYSEAPGHPTAAVPGALDLTGAPIEVEFKAMEILSLSPDGSRWLLRGRNTGDADIDTMLLLGAGPTGTVVAQEGQPIPSGAPGEVYDFLGSSPPHFNEVGQFVFTARARGGDPSVKQKGIIWDGKAFQIVRQESDPAIGLVDLPPNPSGDELFGNSFGSMHVLNDGTIGSQDGSLTNIHSSRRPAIFYGDTAFRQSGVSSIGGDLWNDLNSNEFWTTPDGAHWIAGGDDSGGEVLAVDDAVALRAGAEVGDSGVVADDIFHTKLVADGTWFARGDDASSQDWAARNGELVARTGDPVVTGADEHWSDVFTAFAGDRSGNWVLSGTTDAGDTATDSVLVLNGTTVLLREGDPVDLDGNGQLDDDAFVGRGNETSSAFHPDDMALSDDGVVYLLVSLRDGAGNDLGSFGTGGDALLRITIGGADCPADTDGSGAVDVDDLVAVILAWGTDDPAADVDGSGLVDVDDLVAVVLAWGPCR